MDEVIIEIRDLKKSYPISQKKGFSFIDLPDIVRNVKSGQDPVKKVLDGISLDIHRGECFGIIGANGTGKSTLLRLIAGIIPPDSGTVKVRGSLIPLLSLGVGFTDDLTAHDNVYQYGMILGFTKREMDALYDEIIAFSGLEQYQYMLLRNFSSGMRVKLAFATAAQIRPDILVLDEVLAVGDISFKEKSRQKILEFIRSDRTVVIVSHSMSTISGLCDRALFLQDGKIQALGKPDEVIEAYVSTVRHTEEPHEIAFAQNLLQYRANRQDQDYPHRVVNRIADLKILSLIRERFGADTERSLNDYLTWENLRKAAQLEIVERGPGDDDSGAMAGSSVLSFLKKIGDEPESCMVAREIIRNHCQDGFFSIGNVDLASVFEGKSGSFETPGKVSIVLICDGVRIIPVLFDTTQERKADLHLLEQVCRKVHCDPEQATFILPPEVYSPESLTPLVKRSIRFIAPVNLRDVEEGILDPGTTDDIVIPGTMFMVHEKPVFAGDFNVVLNGQPIPGYRYFDPRKVTPEIKAFYERLELLNQVFSTASPVQSRTPGAFIREVARKDARYFTETEENGNMVTRYNTGAILERRNLMGRAFLLHTGVWDAETCYRNYERWRMTGELFNLYLMIVRSENALQRGRFLATLINTAVRLGTF